MSKSLGNYIGLNDDPADMYGKAMSIPDDLIAPYYELCTDIAEDVIDELVKSLAGGANPRDAKASLAREIVRIYHNDDMALKAEEAWNQTYRDRKGPGEDMIETYHLDTPQVLVDLLIDIGAVDSKSSARRLIEQGGVKVNEQRVSLDESRMVSPDDLVQVGKKRFFRLKKK